MECATVDLSIYLFLIFLKNSAKLVLCCLIITHIIPFKGQTRSRRTSLSSNENGSLNRDAHLSDFAFVEQLEDFRRQLLDLRKDKKKQEDEIIKYKLLCKEKHQNIQVCVVMTSREHDS